MHTRFHGVFRFRLADRIETEMMAFLSIKRMIRVAERTVCVGRARTVSMLFVCMIVVAAGCKRRAAQGEPDPARNLEVVVTNRMEDPAYLEDLKASQRAQTEAAAKRAPVLAKMEEMVAEVRASLPPGADNETVKAELAKRPDWKALEAEEARARDEVAKTLREATEKVRLRMMAEARDVKAVAEGRAVPAATQQVGQKK